MTFTDPAAAPADDSAVDVTDGIHVDVEADDAARDRWVQARERWQALTPAQRGGVVALAVAEVVLTTWAAADLLRRPRGEVRGPKLAWLSLLSVQPFGPPAYLLLGRRRPAVTA